MALFCIDAQSANKAQRTGVENYSFHLIEAMKRLPLLEGERVLLYSEKPLEGKLGDLPSGWSNKVLPWPPKKGWMTFRVAHQLKKDKPSVFFVPSQGVPRCKTPLLTTVHDFGYRRVPSVYDPSVRKRLMSVEKRLKRADHVICVSKMTQSDLLAFTDFTTENSTVVYHGYDKNLFQHQDDQVVTPVLNKYRLGKKFFLSVGRLEMKKNITLLIRAFELFKQRRGTGDPFELVLVGKKGFGFEKMKPFIEHSEYTDQIRVLDFVEDDDL